MVTQDLFIVFFFSYFGHLGCISDDKTEECHDFHGCQRHNHGEGTQTNDRRYVQIYVDVIVIGAFVIYSVHRLA